MGCTADLGANTLAYIALLEVGAEDELGVASVLSSLVTASGSSTLALPSTAVLFSSSAADGSAEMTYMGDGESQDVCQFIALYAHQIKAHSPS